MVMAARTKGKQVDYLALAQRRVQRPADVIPHFKQLIYGRNKKGKTTYSLSGGIENTLYLDPEKGGITMRRLNPYRWPLKTWEDMQEAWGAIRTYELSPKHLGGTSDVPFTRVSVDGLTKINNMALRYVMRVAEERDLDRQPGMVDRRDYNKSGELMKDMLNNFLNLEMGVIFTAQERMMSMDSGDSDEDDESTFFVPDLPAGVRSAVNSIVDVIGRIYTVRVPVGENMKPQRRLQIGVHERYDTGFRSDFGSKIPDFIKNPTAPKVEELLLTGTMPKTTKRKASS